ncbi:hypothetical protein CQ018_07365 [Arthrobacter sp. MYb227]|nr:hypothetical protein CQ018_07365 [Arthrobacter sp. MYb227]
MVFLFTFFRAANTPRKLSLSIFNDVHRATEKQWSDSVVYRNIQYNVSSDLFLEYLCQPYNDLIE